MTIPIDDRGLTLGDGLFETVLAENGALVLWGEHVARLVRGCEASFFERDNRRDKPVSRTSAHGG